MLYCDTSIWIDLLLSKLDETICARLSEEDLYFSDLVLLEIADVLTKYELDPNEAIQFIEQKATRVPFTKSIILKSAQIKHLHRNKQPKFGILDATHYTIAREHNCEFLTTDFDYKGLKGVTII